MSSKSLNNGVDAFLHMCSDRFAVPESLHDLICAPKQLTNPLLIYEATIFLQVWAQSQRSLPEDFGQQCVVTSAWRQPLIVTVTEIEIVTRSLKSIEAPYDGQPLNDLAWHTDDLFELVALNAAHFPEHQEEDEVVLGGREELTRCKQCHGKGTRACDRCRGRGHVKCKRCQGTSVLPCTRCNGAGEHMGVSGNQVQCVLCNGSGGTECPTCNGSGNVVCDRCLAEGKVHCLVCSGEGKLHRKWSLQTIRRTDHRLSQFWHEPWCNQFNASDSMVEPLFAWDVDWTRANLNKDDWQAGLPEEMIPIVRHLIDECWGVIAKLDQTKERATGLRLRISGTFVYRLDVEYQRNAGHFYILAGGKFVIADQLPVLRPSVFNKISSKVSRLLAAELPAERERLSSEFVQDLRDGLVHLADTDSIVPKALHALGIDFNCTKSGYLVRAPVRRSGRQLDDGLCVTVDFRSDAYGQLLLCSKVFLGTAYREAFAEALSLNQELDVGRIAMIGGAGGRQASLVLRDVRFYDSLEVDEYGALLLILMREAVTIRTLLGRE